MVEDIELLRRYAEENAEPAFAELVRRHLDLVYSAALRRLAGDAHSAADVTQQVFTTLARQAGTLAHGVVLPAWLYNTTRNTAVDFIRAERRRRLREQEAHIMQQLDSDSSTADWERLRPLLDAAMDDLSERDREVVVLRFFARRPFADIGAVSRVSEDAARMRVDRALEKLRLLLARRGVASTAAALSIVLAQQSVLAAPAGMAVTVTGTALASGAGVATPVVGLVQFMSTSKLATAVVALVLMATVGTIGYEMYAHRATVAAIAQARQENEALQARVQSLRQRQVAAREAANRKVAGPVPARPPLAVDRAQAAADGAAREASELAAGNAFVERHPEVKAMYLEERRATALGWYGPLFKRLQLSPEQIARCVELMVNEVGGVSVPGGKSIRFTVGLPESETREELRALLGENGYGEFQQARRGGGWDSALMQVVNLGTDLFDSVTPLQGGQAETLRQILMEETKSDRLGMATYRWPEVMRRAREVLSEPQLARLETYRMKEDFREAAERVRMEALKASAR